jgi:hypothetical protein
MLSDYSIGGDVWIDVLGIEDRWVWDQSIFIVWLLLSECPISAVEAAVGETDFIAQSAVACKKAKSGGR